MRHLRMRVEGEGGGGRVIFGDETLMQGALELSQLPLFRCVSAEVFCAGFTRLGVNILPDVCLQSGGMSLF